MGNKQESAKRTSTISRGTISTALTLTSSESRVFRFTEESIQRTFSQRMNTIDNQMQRFPQEVIEQISKFLTIKDLINLQCTNTYICERFFTSLPYSIYCGQILYKMYEDRRGVAKEAVNTKNPQWPEVLQQYMLSKREWSVLPNSLQFTISQGFQRHIIYPPVLMDEVSREGLNTEFQRVIMQKLIQKNEFHNVSELQYLNECRQFAKKQLQIVLDIRTIQVKQYKVELPTLLKLITIIMHSISTLLQIVRVAIECVTQFQDTIGFMDFYLYNWQMYRIWMQSLDQEISPYLELLDIVLKENQYDAFPPMTIQWIMMSMWCQYIYMPVRYKLRNICCETLMQISTMKSCKYEKFLLRDYITQLVDLSTHQGNVMKAGHSKFQFCEDLEHILFSISSQNYTKDLSHWGYIFSQQLLESRLIKRVIERRVNEIQEQLRIIFESEEFERRCPRLDKIVTEQQYQFQLLNVDKIQNRMKQILYLNQTPKQNNDPILSITYSKKEQDQREVYLTIYHQELHKEIDNIIRLEVLTDDKVLMKDKLIEHRQIEYEYANELCTYFSLANQVITIKKQSKKPQHNSKNNNNNNNNNNKQQQFQKLQILNGMNLAQSLTQQYLDQQ